MAIQFIKEDGTGLDDATVYADLDDADQYLENSDRKTAWRTSSSKERQAALIQGADYIDQTFRNRYKGERFSSDQRLEWPRNSVFDELGVLTTPLAGLADSIPEDYFYDIEQTDVAGKILTIAKGQYRFEQDVTR